MFGELGVELRMKLEWKIKQFYQLTNEMMSEHDYYRAYFTLQKVFVNCNKRFAKACRTTIDDKIHSGENKKSSVLDLIKACPKCGLYWMKIEACSISNCGSRPTTVSDWSQLSNFTFLI